jgi:hypothetical protein
MAPVLPTPIWMPKLKLATLAENFATYLLSPTFIVQKNRPTYPSQYWHNWSHSFTEILPNQNCQSITIELTQDQSMEKHDIFWAKLIARNKMVQIWMSGNTNRTWKLFKGWKHKLDDTIRLLNIFYNLLSNKLLLREIYDCLQILLWLSNFLQQTTLQRYSKGKDPPILILRPKKFNGVETLNNFNRLHLIKGTN